MPKTIRLPLVPSRLFPEDGTSTEQQLLHGVNRSEGGLALPISGHAKYHVIPPGPTLYRVSRTF
jgi:hypothetical protein